MGIPLRGSDGAVLHRLDGPTAMAATAAVSEARRDVAGSLRRHPELLSYESRAGGCRGHQREHQDSAPAWPWVQEPTLSAAESPAPGRNEDRIRSLCESRMQYGPCRILS